MRTLKGGDSQLDLISYRGDEDAESEMVGEDSRRVSLAEGKLEERLRAIEAQLAQIGKHVGYIISAGMVVAIWAFFEFVAPKLPSYAWVFAVAAGFLYVVFLLLRGAVRGFRKWLEPPDYNWEQFLECLLGLGIAIYAAGWFLGYFPSPWSLLELDRPRRR
jgi:hypothetical protein